MAQQLNRMYDCLGTIAHERDVISPGDSNELNGLLRDIQNLLIRSMQPRPFNPYRVQELDGYYHLLIGFVKRLEVRGYFRSGMPPHERHPHSTVHIADMPHDATRLPPSLLAILDVVFIFPLPLFTANVLINFFSYLLLYIGTCSTLEN
jgi:hypothetical protein